MQPKLSVIVPVYNGAEFLNQCLDSIIAQTFEDMEIIIVDNKSTDKSGLICDEYALRDNRIKVIHREEHGWICDSRNEGIRVAVGKWITFVDVDDWLSVDYYSTVFDKMPNEDMDIFCTGGYFVEYTLNKEVLTTGAGNFDINQKDQIHNMIRQLFPTPIKTRKGYTNHGNVWDKLYKTEFIKNNDLMFPEDILYLDDAFFNLLAFEKADRIAGTDYIGYHYRINPDSITRKYRPDWPDKMLHLYDRIEKNLKENELNEIVEEIPQRMLYSLYSLIGSTFFHPSNYQKYTEKRKAFNQFKNTTVFREAIWKECKDYSLKGKLFVFLLRTPFCFPFILNQYRRKRKWRNGR